MEIRTKFDVGQEVYVIHNQSFYKRNMCPMCDGQGYVVFSSPLYTGKEQNMNCPNCHGEKVVSGEKVKKYTIEKTKIVGIKTSSRAETHISYKVKSDQNRRGELSYPEKDDVVFATEEEAIVKRDYLNSGYYIWNHYDTKPIANKKIIVRDFLRNEYANHFWNGTHYYKWVEDINECLHETKSDIKVFAWRYEEDKEDVK